MTAVGTVRPRTSRISQVVTLVAVVVPPLGLVLAMGLLWGIEFHWVDLALFAGMYVLCAFGTTVGFHRFFTHRGFETRAPVKALLAILGCMTMQGPVTQWVTDHRKHHALSDQPGDPHSPHGHGEGSWGALRGFVHAHVGWMFRNLGMEQGREYGRDLYEDRLVRAIDRLYLLWVVLTLGIPFRDRLRGRRDWRAGVEGLVWGGLDPDRRLSARDVQRELDLPHVRTPGLPLAGRSAEQLGRRAARLRRGLAQQPPRVPGLRAARAPTAGSSTSPGG